MHGHDLWLDSKNTFLYRQSIWNCTAFARVFLIHYSSKFIQHKLKILLLHQYVKCAPKNTLDLPPNTQQKTRKHRFSLKHILNPKKIWQWKSYSKYIEFIGLVSVLYTWIFIVLYGPVMISFTGYIANGFDACVALPQFIKNYRKGYIENLRYLLLIWL